MEIRSSYRRRLLRLATEDGCTPPQLTFNWTSWRELQAGDVVAYPAEPTREENWRFYFVTFIHRDEPGEPIDLSPCIFTSAGMQSEDGKHAVRYRPAPTVFDHP